LGSTPLNVLGGEGNNKGLVIIPIWSPNPVSDEARNNEGGRNYYPIPWFHNPFTQ